MTYKEQIDKSRIPQHVAVIMDGNGRWAKRRLQNRSFGHEEGVTTVRRITEAAGEIGLKYLTLYTFSTENWNRPEAEVNTLMHLIVTAIERETPDLIRQNVHLTMIGDTDRLPAFALESLQRSIQATSHCTGLTLCLALSYSSRWEIVEACRKVASKVASGELAAAAIDEADICGALSTADMPDPDLLIRTAGDQRISNFLLWQIAYAELYFTPVLWPDFTPEDFYEAICHYQHRERRFGLTSEQVNEQ